MADVLNSVESRLGLDPLTATAICLREAMVLQLVAVVLAHVDRRQEGL